MTPVNSTKMPSSANEIGVVASDGQLLKLFLERNDEGAFAKLVHVHGPMVLGVCRRVIGNQHDAEDAFQATFLVFARKAQSVCTERTVAGWLYGVAYRTALKARNAAMKKRTRETPLPDNLAAAIPESEHWTALRPLLDQELNRLPETYRLPLVLCYLEGKSHSEAALELGCPEGTLSVRLMRAKTRLAESLRRRGLVLSVAALGPAPMCGVASAGAPSANLAASTVKVASAFAVGQGSLAGLVSSDVASLTGAILKATQFPGLIALTGTAIGSAGLLVLGSNWGMVPRSREIPGVNPEPAHTAAPPLNEELHTPARDGVPPSSVPPQSTEGGSDSVPAATNDNRVAQGDWGSIKGRVVVDRLVPPLPLLVKKLDSATKDASVCAAVDIPDESLEIDPETRGLANVVIWLTKKPAKIHPELIESKQKEVVFDQQGCRFIPHMLVVRTDQQVRVISGDAVAHNTHTYPLKNMAMNNVVQPNSRSGYLDRSLTLAERLPIKVGCDIHPWMQA